MSEMFIVYSYNSINISNYPTKYIVGIYDNILDARERQYTLCKNKKIDALGTVKNENLVTFVSKYNYGDNNSELFSNIVKT